MSQIEWYYARDNQQSGPVSALELKQLAAAGQLLPDDLVWREGMTEWSVARNVRGLFEDSAVGAAAAAASALKAPEPTTAASPAPRAEAGQMRHPFDPLLDWCRPRFDVRLIDSIGRAFRLCGSFGLLVAAVLNAIICVYVALNGNPVGAILAGIFILAALLVLQYLAGKFCDALDRLNRATPGRLSSLAFPDGLSLLSKVWGLTVLLLAIWTAFGSSSYELEPLLYGVAALAIFVYLSAVAFSPASLGFTIGGESGPAEEALDALTYLVKATARAVPAAFGAGVVCGTLLLGYACFLILNAGALPRIGETWFSSVGVLIASAALPFAAYLLFLLYFLLHDLCRAVLSLPAKPDAAAEKTEDKQ